MIEEKTAFEYFDELLEIHTTENTIQTKYARLRILLEKITKDLTRKESLQFSNLFSRLSFVCEKQFLPKNIHGLRISANKVLQENYSPTLNEYETHFKFLSEFISKALKVSVPQNISILYPKTEFKTQFDNSNKTRVERLRVELVTINSDSLICMSSDSQSDDYITVNLANLNPFTSVKDFWKGAQLFLVNIEIDESENYFPKFIILEPDYLIDISSISECSQDYGKSELFYLKSKFDLKI